MTQGQLAYRAGLKPSHISRIEGGNYRVSRQDTLEKLAFGLGLTISELTSEIRGRGVTVPKETPEMILNRLKLAQPVSVPVYTEFKVHAGGVMEPVEYVYRARERTVEKGVEGYLVSGYCLEPLIKEGDIIIVNREAQYGNDDAVICLLDGGPMLARYRTSGDNSWLENNDNKINPDDCQILAVVIEVIRRLK